MNDFTLWVNSTNPIIFDDVLNPPNLMAKVVSYINHLIGDCKLIYAEVNSIEEFTDTVGDIEDLTTTDKSSIVAAVNENASGITALKKTVVTVNEDALQERGTVTGKIMYNANEVTLNIKFTSSVTASNTPGIYSIASFSPAVEAALTCIDITSGIASAITASGSCGISTSGVVFIKEVTSDHIYAITGTYIRA